MDTLWMDAKYAIRGMIRRPGFTLVVVVTLALGIGANAAIFSVINSVMLQPLPYANPDRVVFVWEKNYLRGVETNVVSPANFVAWRDQQQVFDEFGGIAQYSGTITGDQGPERIGVVQLSPSIFRMLGVGAEHGRLLTDDDASPEAPTVVVLGHGFWQRRFGSDPDIIGQTVTLNGNAIDVVGILPRGFAFELPVTFNSAGAQDVWFPMQVDEDWATARGRWLTILGKVGTDVTVERAQSQMETVAQRLEQEHPDFQTGWTVNVVPIHSQLVGDVTASLLILLGAVGFVLLIACANVANLLLSRATGRQQEIAVRSALGAARSRVLRQLLTESMMLAVAGGLAGLVVAFAAVRGLVALGPDNLPRLDELGVDGIAIAFTVGVSILTGVLFGLVPALKLSAFDLKISLTEGGVRGGTGLRHNRTRSALVVAEFALSLMLLVGAGLLARSFAKLMDAGVGFDTDNIITAQLALPSQSYPDHATRARAFESLVNRLQATPGVNAASAITFLPLAGTGSATSFWVNDRPIPHEGEFPVADVRWVQRDFHRALGVPLVAGRHFDVQDTDDAPLAVIINEWAANEFWPNADPIGQTISMPWGDTLVAEVIGVVGDVRHNGPGSTVRNKLYWEHRQFQSFNQMTIFARTSGDPTNVVAALRREVAAVDESLPLYNVRTVDSYLSASLAQARFSMLALSLFAVVALVLASIGIYGVMSYAVSERTREIGIKMALGAGTGTVTAQIVKSGLVLTGIALAFGIGGSLALSRFMRGMVFELSTNDPITIVAVATLLTTVALAASYVPARRASKVDPVEALRYE